MNYMILSMGSGVREGSVFYQAPSSLYSYNFAEIICLMGFPKQGFPSQGFPVWCKEVFPGHNKIDMSMIQC